MLHIRWPVALRDTQIQQNTSPYYKRGSHLGFKSYKLEYTFQKKHCSEADIEAIQYSGVQFRFLVILTKEIEKRKCWFKSCR